jgi:hypothetical protein
MQCGAFSFFLIPTFLSRIPAKTPIHPVHPFILRILIRSPFPKGAVQPPVPPLNPGPGASLEITQNGGFAGDYPCLFLTTTHTHTIT